MKLHVLLLALTLSASTALCEIYTWKDSRGTTFYTNSLDEIPTRYQKRARILDVATGKKGGPAVAQPGVPAPPAPAAPSPAPLTTTPPAPPAAAPAPAPVAAPAPVPAAPNPAIANPAGRSATPTVESSRPQRATGEQRRAQRRRSRDSDE